MTTLRRPNRRRVPAMHAYATGQTCTRTGKARFLDERGATAAIAELAHRDPDRDQLNAYRCPHCSDWHVGHDRRPADAD